MKEYVLTLFLAVTTGITLFIFTLTRPQIVPVFDVDDILFEHQSMHGHIIVRSNAYDEVALSFLNRGIGGMTYAGSSYATTYDEASFMTLPATAHIPFTTHALMSTHPHLHEIIVVEAGSTIAHHAYAKKTTCEQTSVFLVASSDLVGSDVLIMGLDAHGRVIVEIEIP